MKEAGTKVSESVEGEIETSQLSQVVQLVTFQPREEVVAEHMMLTLFKAETQQILNFIFSLALIKWYIAQFRVIMLHT